MMQKPLFFSSKGLGQFSSMTMALKQRHIDIDVTSYRRRCNIMTPRRVVCLLGKHCVFLTGVTSTQGQYSVVYRSGISTQDDLMLVQFLQEGIDVSGYNGRLDANDGRDVNGLMFCFPMSLVLMLACLMEEIVCCVGMEKDSMSVALKKRDRWMVAVF